jgi:hypothetical protein
MKHYLRLYLQSFIIVMTLSTSWASTYINEEVANEGLCRGNEAFTRSTGIFNINAHPIKPLMIDNQSLGVKDVVDLKFNGVLIHPSLVLTCRHSIKGNKYNPFAGSFWLAPDAGKAWEDTINVETSAEHRLYLQQFSCPLDLNNIYLPPDETTDLAIVQLTRPLNDITCLPLLLDKPQRNWSNGYFVSYAPVYSLTNPHTMLAQNKRHIAILDIEEDNFNFSEPYLISKWLLKGNPLDPLNRQFIPEKEKHRLKAFTQESDSGATFVIRLNQKDYVAGIHRGRMVSEESLGEVATLITPLYPHKKWITEILASVNKNL